LVVVNLSAYTPRVPVQYSMKSLGFKAWRSWCLFFEVLIATT